MKFLALVGLLVILVLIRVPKDPPMKSNLIAATETGSVRIKTKALWYVKMRALSNVSISRVLKVANNRRLGPLPSSLDYSSYWCSPSSGWGPLCPNWSASGKNLTNLPKSRPKKKNPVPREGLLVVDSKKSVAHTANSPQTNFWII